MGRKIHRIYVCRKCGCLFAPEVTNKSGSPCPACNEQLSDEVVL